ncbi:MAG: endonuclease [Flavobacteriia bacterium]|jgi:endonuclease I
MKNILALIFILPTIIFAQIPTGYYNSAQGLTGDALKIALHNIIDNHTVVSYNGLWNCYSNTDRKSNGKIWDIYSDVPGGTPAYEFTFSSDQCGSYAVEGDCYNREHTWPQSWFNSEAGAVSDLFHVYPTDGKVNGERDNFPYGNVGTTIYFQSTNGGKLGITTDLGYNTVVFEPIDEYKGDVARNYFYMSTRYYSEDFNWTSSAATIKSEIKAWELNVLLTWHHQDPVSSKETARNNVIYNSYQHNRNPFIDHPEWADSIWQQTVNDFVTADVKEYNELDFISLFPNPAEGKVYLNLNEVNDFEIELSDINGQKLDFEILKTDNLIEINTENWNKGMYFLTIKTDQNIRTLNFLK